jgi:predicted neuraminidase
MPLPVSVTEEDAPKFHADFVDDGQPVGIAHVPSICQLPDGRLAAAWYAGSREGGKDVSIMLATRTAGVSPEWGKPVVLVDREQATRELGRYVKKVGNAIIFTQGGTGVGLLYVTIALGGWSSSSLNLKWSPDGGRTWQPSRRLTLSPFFNVSELVRCPPRQMGGGVLAVPVYHEVLGKFPELLWLRTDPARPAWLKTRMAGGRTSLQPDVIPFDAKSALAYFRDVSDAGQLRMAETQDGGRSWSAASPLDLPNPNSSSAAMRLSDGAVLMAFNDSKEERSNLRLAVSPDGKTGWRRLATLDEKEGVKFAYPYFLRARDGTIHLVYSWKMKRIKHVEFNEAWVRARQAEAGP